METSELCREVGKINWFHRIRLAPDLVTPGRDESARKLEKLGLPEDLTGKSVLDIGAWDGFFSFEAERRGASRVLATDSFIWQHNGNTSKAGFELARRALGSRVEDRLIDVMDLSPREVGTFDVVLFLGVLYHLRHPLLALEKVASVTAPGGMVILETHVDMLHVRRPAIAFYPERELNGDPTNWCGPNPAAVEGMLKAAGFRAVKAHTPAPVTYMPPAPAAPAPARSRGERLLRLLGRQPRVAAAPPPSPEVIGNHRMIFHAWK